MVHIAHIINPFQAEQQSDLFRAQPITFESMRRAKSHAQDIAHVTLLSAHFEEDISMLPDGFESAGLLRKSVLDCGNFEKKLKLPLIADILVLMYRASDAEVLVYTNVDIAVKPEFYEFIAEEMSKGKDALIINRRRIPDAFLSNGSLEEMYAENGKSHPGFDCFVFRRELFPKFELANICIGVPFIGIATAQNIFCHAANYTLYEKKYLTFHIGMEIFKGRAPRDYFNYNRKEFWKAMRALWPLLDNRKFPYGKRNIIARFLKWGWHPSIPIRLALMLEKRRYLGDSAD